MLERLLAASLVVGLPIAAWPCSTVGINTPEGLVRQAELIVRVRATGYTQPPDPTRRGASTATGLDALATPPGGGIVQFTVLEVLRGSHLAPVGLAIPGTLSAHDDYNDRPAPYTFVRKDGRGGNCFALDYRDGGEFLLFLKKDKNGAWTPYWSPLAPVNEQLRGDDDAWLSTIRALAARVTTIAARVH